MPYFTAHKFRYGTYQPFFFLWLKQGIVVLQNGTVYQCRETLEEQSSPGE